MGTEPPSEERRRDRVLSAEELASVWQAAGAVGDEFGAIIRLLMLTGQRRDEVAAMAWSEIDLERALWTLPAVRTKNCREHEVPLSRHAVALLPPRREGRALVFGQGKGGFSGFSRAKARLDKAAGLAMPWVLHDIRRSLVTHMNELGIDPHVIEAVVNHVSGARGGIAGRYNFAAYREQKRVALQRWADWVAAVVEGRAPAGNVVAFASRSA
jgi:integrase